MNTWKNKLGPMLLALTGVLFLVPVIKDAVQGEPIRAVFLVLALLFLALAVTAGAKSAAGSGTPKA